MTRTAVDDRSTRIEFSAPAPLMSMNDRHHWSRQRRDARTWRIAARVNAHLTIPQPRTHPPCTVAIDLPVADKRRRDPHNYYPTVKHIIDGLVDAGIWPDDTPEWVTTVEPTLKVGGPVVVTLTPREAA